MTKITDKNRTVNNFRSCRFSCVRCSSKNIEVMNVDTNQREIVDHDISSSIPINNSDVPFYVAAILYCRECRHRFYVKILDQGIINTNVYFDNSLSE